MKKIIRILSGRLTEINALMYANNHILAKIQKSMSEKRIDWDPEKNLKLREERGLSFERIHAAIEAGHLLEIIPHSNPNYTHQKVMVIDIDAYIVLVPFVEAEDHLFLKTAFPSRKATKTYLSEGRKK